MMNESETIKPLRFEAEGVPLESLPEPVGYRLLIAPVMIDDKTEGGIFLPESAKKLMQHYRTVGKVLKLGASCYQHAKFNGEAWCKPGDIVQFKEFEGHNTLIAHDDMVYDLKYINDDAIFGTDPEGLGRMFNVI